MKKVIQAPINKEEIHKLKSGDSVYITGTIYTARDAAHKRMYEALQAGEELPIDMTNNLIYYMGQIYTNTFRLRTGRNDRKRKTFPGSN